MADRFARTADRIAREQDARAAALAEQRAHVRPPARATSARSTSAPARVRSRSRSRRSCARWSASIAFPSCSRSRASERPAFGNVELVEGDATALPFPDASFDLAGNLADAAPRRAAGARDRGARRRVTRPGGRVLVVDQLGPADPLEALAVDRFERARDALPHPAPARDRPAPPLRGERARPAPGALRRRAPRARAPISTSQAASGPPGRPLSTSRRRAGRPMRPG